LNGTLYSLNLTSIWVSLLVNTFGVKHRFNVSDRLHFCLFCGHRLWPKNTKQPWSLLKLARTFLKCFITMVYFLNNILSSIWLVLNGIKHLTQTLFSLQTTKPFDVLIYMLVIFKLFSSCCYKNYDQTCSLFQHSVCSLDLTLFTLAIASS